MGRRKHRSRYESEIHLGFLAIVSLLVFLNFVSNFVIFRARSTQQEETLNRLRMAAVAASREVQAKFPGTLTPAELERVRTQNGLAGLTLLPVKPADHSYQAKRDWFRTVLRRFPPTDHPDLADMLYRANLHELTRGNSSEYYYLYPIPAGAGGSLLVLTVDRPDLAYLDDSRNLLMVVLIGAVAIVALVYFLLSRFIFRPFRRLKETAKHAGRLVEDTADETEAVVEEYERVIKQLTETRTELLRLNAEARDRADSLALFNRYLMESSRSGVVTLDPVGKVLAVNDTAIAMLGFQPEREFTGASYTELFAGREQLTNDIKRTLLNDATQGYHEYSSKADQQPEAILGVTYTDIKDREHGPTGLLLMINDLTEVSQLRHELENRNRLAALGEMAGGLAHQIRNSLGAISGYATLLKKRLKREKLSTKPAEELLDETREAGELINRFLSFARPFEYSPSPTDLGRLVEECLESFRIRPDYGAVELRTTYQKGLLIEADPILLKQAVGNIIDNAINSYCDRRGLVEITVAMQSERAVLTVRDYGCGIPSDEVDRIFTPFFSARPSGTGLGLPLAAKIVDLHGGTIGVESEVGRGSRFTVSLALSTGEPTDRLQPEISRPA